MLAVILGLDNNTATILAALIGAVPTSIFALAAMVTAMRAKRDLTSHVQDEGVTSEAILRGLERLGALEAPAEQEGSTNA